MQGNMLDFEEGWSKIIADLKEPKTFDTIGERTTFIIHYVDGNIMFLSRAYEGCVIFKSELRKVHERLVNKGRWNEGSNHRWRTSQMQRFRKENSNST